MFTASAIALAAETATAVSRRTTMGLVAVARSCGHLGTTKSKSASARQNAFENMIGTTASCERPASLSAQCNAVGKIVVFKCKKDEECASMMIVE